jgi:hypothetical protein
MDLLRIPFRIADATVGRTLRWAGGQWAKGRYAAERREQAPRELLAAAGEVLAESRLIFNGMGQAVDGPHRMRLSTADARAAALVAEIPDNDLQPLVATLRECARPFAEGNSQGAKRADLERAFEAVAQRVRALIQTG